jgi:hypothetical protein
VRLVVGAVVAFWDGDRRQERVGRIVELAFEARWARVDIGLKRTHFTRGRFVRTRWIVWVKTDRLRAPSAETAASSRAGTLPIV